MYVYIKSEPGLFTCGHYTPAGAWYSESDHETEEQAAERVAVLNGGQSIPVSSNGRGAQLVTTQEHAACVNDRLEFIVSEIDKLEEGTGWQVGTAWELLRFIRESLGGAR